jgi:MFS family permease
MGSQSANDEDREARAGFRRRVLLVGVGLLVSTMAQPIVVGRLPLSLLLKNQLAVEPQTLAAFWALGTFPWYCKPLAGLLSDAFPLFGTRRRSYLMVSGLLGGVCWAVMALLPRTYAALFAAVLALNVAMVFASTVTGGLLVETGQRHNVTGALASMRWGIEGAIYLVVGPVGGFLATRAFGWTAGIGAAMLIALIPLTARLLDEPRATPDGSAAQNVWRDAGDRLRSIVRSRNMLAVATLIFLFYMAPGIQTALLYYQQDTLKLDPPFMGFLQLLGGAGGLGAAVVYGAVCRKIPIRRLLVMGILCNVASTLFYLGYRSRETAMIVSGAVGFVGMLASLPLFDLAVRAPPKGSEGLGYSLLMTVYNVTVFAVADVIGSYLFGRRHVTFQGLVWVSAAASALVLFFVPFLPAALMAQRDR